MGLLDWITEGVGSDMGGSSMGFQQPPQPDLAASPPPPPAAGPMPAGSDPMTAGGDMPNGPGLAPPPLPAARPPGADAGSSALPPNAAPTSGAGMPPGPPLSLMPDAAPSMAPPQGPQATGFLGRALGLDRNREASLRGSLGAGLKSVGENANKPGLAAFAGSMGSGIEGGKTADDKTIDQQSKYLTQAIAAAQQGNTTALNVARTKLALAQAEGQAIKNKEPDKQSVVNSQQQLYLRGLGAVSQDPAIKASLNAVRQAQAMGDPKAIKAATDSHNALIEETKKKVFSTLGVNEKDAAKIGKMPGFSADNPVPAAGLSKQKFDELPVGAYFINPKDNRLLIKQPPAGANPAAPAQSPGAAPPAPAPVTAPAGSAADREDDE